MSIKQAILEKNQGNEVDKNEYTNLIMDDMPINTISAEDKTFLEGFIECQFLSLNSTNLKNISNLPKMPKLERLELCDNGIADGMAVIATQYPALKVLKVSGNKISTLDEVKHLGSLPHLESLDLVNNPCLGTSTLDTSKLSDGDKAALEAKKTEIRALLPKLEVLNGYNKDGQEVLSDESYSQGDEENGEDEMSGDEGREEEEYGEESGDGEPAQKKQKTGEAPGEEQ